MKYFHSSVITMSVLAASLILSTCKQADQSPYPPFPEDHTEKLEWWKDARFGMFIHWGPVSLRGTEISWSRGKEIPVEEYDNLYKQFNPVNFDADEWVSVAKAAGMKYIVFTSKHHDGFCNWNTRYTDYNIMNSPFRRDIMAELAAACQKQDIALGFYHSTCDWHHPDFPLTGPGGSVVREVSDLDRYTDYLKNQSVEIIEKYGPLLVMWYDVPQQFDSIRGQGVIDRIREVQPGILVNNRSGAPGDFDTPERRIGSFQADRPWETCTTIGTQWAWKPDDRLQSVEQCLHSLIRSAGGDGNLLLNVGPGPDGQIEPLQVERLKEIGTWLTNYGFTIYGTRGGPFKPTDWGVSTRKENKIYLHLLNWPGDLPGLVLPGIGMEVTRCSVVGGGPLSFSIVGNEIYIETGRELVRPVSTIIELEVNGNAMDIVPVEVNPVSLSFMKAVKGSSNTEPFWSDYHWIDIKSVVNGDWSGDFWHPAETDSIPRVEIDLGEMQSIKRAVIYERGQNIIAYELQYRSGYKWITCYQGAGIGEKTDVTFPEIQAQYFRLVITASTSIPGIYEIVLF
jgi:alpha-L-fucosidase